MVEDKQHIRTRSIVEVMGKPKEHVQSMIDKLISEIEKDSTLMLMAKDVAEPSEIKDQKVWSVFAELEIIFKNPTALSSFCFEYMPSSVEIIKPESITLRNSEFSNIINDLQSKLHTVDMIAKKLGMENKFLRKNFNVSLKNQISILLKLRGMSMSELSSFTGVNEDELKLIVEDLEKEGKIKKEEDLFVLSN